MSRRILLAFLVIASLFVGSCNYRPTVIPTSVPARSAWLKDFLNQSVCQLPCWNNITPGITAYEDAKTILLKDTNLKITETTSFMGKEIEWNFIGDGSSGLIGTESIGEQVEKIIFYFGKDQWLPLDDLLAVYPNPSSFGFYNSRDLRFCELWMSFEPNGMLAASGMIPCKATKKDGVFSTEINVTPDIPLQYIHLYTEEQVEKQAKMLGKMEWKGYGEYLKEFRP